MVQSVGFRPYVYRLAHHHALTGFVMNTAEGAVVELEGPATAIEAFVADLPALGPPLMRVTGIERRSLKPRGDAEFVIRASSEEAPVLTLVPPDVCVCADCLREVRDPANRRFEYPFTNCTNCGPRYSIILDVPYDRRKTTMAAFELCSECRGEYGDPGDRRFHAQPNACAVCGPSLQLKLPGEPPANGFSARQVLEVAAEKLLSGGIVAWKGLGGYQLACDARQPAAVAELRHRKRRSEKPFAVMVRSVSVAEEICAVSDAERATLTGPERPIVLLKARPVTAGAEAVGRTAGLSAAARDAVSPGISTLGVMLPSTPMHDLLFEILRERGAVNAVLVATSGNRSEEPIAIENTDAEARLGSIADLFVHHNRSIHTRVDDSVVRVLNEIPGGMPMILRRARGYSPAPVWLGLGNYEVLACGAQQKSTLCLTKEGFALPSQHLGDLENLETLEFFEQTLERMCRLFHVTPQTIAHDLHPGYLSSQMAKRIPARRWIGVQHHHAHIASCMAEHQLRGQVIGVVWDGTGLGTDGTIWGGEFLAADLAAFERLACIRPVLLAGGDTAVREPWRVARSYLQEAFDSAIPESVACCHSVSPRKLHVVDAMLEKRINTTATTSCGRLFDAVAALMGLRQTVSFEGQAAMELEAIAGPETSERYDFDLDGASPIQVDLRPMVRQIVRDTQKGHSAAHIAARFHNTLVAVISSVCRRIRKERELSRVCLSGGCFQNVRLLHGAVAALQQDGFDVFFQRLIPCNDGGVSVGQAAIACELMARGE
jgi:hydrogenase maturation protein HypF